MRCALSDNASYAPFQIVALAASAGGITALMQVLSELPAEFSAPVLVLQHLDPRHKSLIAEILGRRTRLRVKEAEAGDQLTPGTIYTAPPDRHLLVEPDDTLALTRTELVHFVRPSADLLFESVAARFGPGAIAVVLTGMGSDGAMGVSAIKKRGGTVIVQDEASSEFFGMPGAAIKTGDVDFILPLAEIAPALIKLVMVDEIEAPGGRQVAPEIGMRGKRKPRRP
ncbi:MAG: chemotaxis protein CheB [Armatimonadota bacterium]